MKTNQRMLVTIGQYKQEIDHLSMMGNLNSLWDYGNEIRRAKGQPLAKLDRWLANRNTCEFIIELERRIKPVLNQNVLNTPNSGDFNVAEIVEVSSDKCVINGLTLTSIKTKKGRSGGTWAHLYLLLKAAAYLDPSFELQMYEAFVANKILQKRDESGDEFKELNLAIDAYLQDRQGKDNKGVYIQISKALKARIAPDGDSWNTATHSQLEKRSLFEQQLIQLMRMGFVKDYPQLKECIGRL